MRLFAGTVFSYKFTFHYVSIKSAVLSLPLFATGIFTFHYVSIKSYMNEKVFLNSILFTFHYVSIKSYIYGKGNDRFSKIYIPLCIY